MPYESPRLTPEVMRERWTQPPALPTFPSAPDNPQDWKNYFDRCFPEGVLFMYAHDEPSYPIKDDSPLVLSQQVWVDSIDGDLAVVVVSEIYDGRPLYLANTQQVLAIAPGVLVLGNNKGQFVRLDGHLTDEEKAVVSRVKTGGIWAL